MATPPRTQSNPVVAALFFVALAAAWEFGVRLFGVKSYLLPALSDIGVAFWEARAMLLDHSLVTLGEVLSGFALAAVLGVALAALIHVVPVARSTLYPVVIALQSIPKVGLAPLMVVWLGYGFGSKLVMAFLFAFFPIVISTLGGLASVPSNLEEHFRALGASRWTMFARLQVPAAMPNFMDGCKVAMPLAVIGAIVGEFVGSNNGLGNVILLATGSSQTALTFAALLTVTMLSLVLFYVVELLSKFVWWRAV
ncbi:ABC transporter permease [Sphingomonas cavernae]|uniref:ABC transporter permease n=1 Tax=Sphingomonas cavernae TaxID=2320861 RepID=A0A418WUP9_9SPHN|nr:ABC transporter permease [Sphingomonas cavernae]RJF96398.1 ABC transporter permease [Sphingomonas cavernae]